METLAFIRETAARMYAHWADENFGWTISPTADFFAENIDSGNFEFWTAQENGRILCELYLVKVLEDPDFADGHARCYLCAFRTVAERRGQGIGSKLLAHVLARAESLGFREVTIGVEEREEANVRLYRRFGFTKTVKQAHFDPCNRMPDGRPCPDRFLLLLKEPNPKEEREQP